MMRKRLNTVYFMAILVFSVWLFLYLIRDNEGTKSIRLSISRIPQRIATATRVLQVKKDAVSPTPSYAILLEKNLAPGDSGADVRLLQVALTVPGLLPPYMVTAFYGDMTKTAVSAFQKAAGLPMTGIVDDATRRAFNAHFGVSHDRSYYLSLIPTPVPQTNEKTPTDNAPWGVAERVSGTEHAWSMKVGEDPAMATAKEVFDALNAYRAKKGVHGLNWDGNLGDFAVQRADFFIKNGGLDDHKGFTDYLNNEDNVKRLDFTNLGENSSCGYRMTGTHLIEWIFAGDEPHDSNQLNSAWSDVGVGVNGTCVNIVFGYGRIN